MSNGPVTEDEMKLADMLFHKISDLYPDWKMGDRTDLAMSLFDVVKKWAHEGGSTKKANLEPLPAPRVLRGEIRR